MNDVLVKRKLVFFSILNLRITQGVRTNFLVILFKGGQIFTSFGEFTFLHTFADIPMNESTLGIHQIELVIKTSPGFSDGSGVGQHTESTLDSSEVTTRDSSRSTAVDTDLETSRTPVNELDGTLGLDGRDGSVGVLGDNITTVQQTTRHVLAMTGITLDHLVVRLETSIGDLLDRELLMVSLGRGDDRGVGDQREVNTRVGDQVGLEFVQINVERTVETQGSSDGGDDLSDQTVEVGIRGTLNVQVAATDIVDSFVINHEGDIRVLQSGMGGQDGVVGFNNRGSNLRSRVNRELKLGLLTIVNGKTLHQESTETRTGTTAKGVEDQEALKTSTVVSQLTDAIQDRVNQLFADSVVTTSIVVGGIFLTSDKLFYLVI